MFERVKSKLLEDLFLLLGIVFKLVFIIYRRKLSNTNITTDFDGTKVLLELYEFIKKNHAYRKHYISQGSWMVTWSLFTCHVLLVSCHMSCFT